MREKYVIRDFHPLVFFYGLGLLVMTIGLGLGIAETVLRLLGHGITAATVVLVALLLIAGSQFTLFGRCGSDMESNKATCAEPTSPGARRGPVSALASFPAPELSTAPGGLAARAPPRPHRLAALGRALPARLARHLRPRRRCPPPGARLRRLERRLRPARLHLGDRLVAARGPPRSEPVRHPRARRARCGDQPGPGATAVPGIALVLSPVTLAFGPVVAYNVAALLAPALSAWTAFLLVRSLTRSWPAATLAGAFFGFSPYMAGQLAAGHLHLTSVYLVPLAALTVVRYLRAELTRRGFAIRLGLVLAGQILISTEIAFTLTLALLLALAAVAVFAPGSRGRVLARA